MRRLCVFGTVCILTLFGIMLTTCISLPLCLQNQLILFVNISLFSPISALFVNYCMNIRHKCTYHCEPCHFTNSTCSPVRRQISPDLYCLGWRFWDRCAILQFPVCLIATCIHDGQVFRVRNFLLTDLLMLIFPCP